jgi:hypothetical protein
MEQWERDASACRRVASILHDLPAGFVVFDHLELPRPTHAVVDHLVVGPRNVWAVWTRVCNDPVTRGRGRNSDTLWSGRTPLRTELEAADWEASALSALIGYEVEPVMCLVTPSLPEPAFDFHGIRICRPETLANQVATSTADFVDVATVADAVQRRFGVEPVKHGVLPTLGLPLEVVKARIVRPPQRRRTLGARLHVLRSNTIVRTVAVIALIGGIVAFLPAILGAWNSVASEGAERITDVLDDPENSAGDVSGVTDSRFGSPAAVQHTVTCPTPGGGWMLEWRWPGALPAGVAGYGIRTSTAQAPPVVRTLLPWSDPTSRPAPVRLPERAEVTIFTDYRGPDGAVLSTTSETVRSPTAPC